MRPAICRTRMRFEPVSMPTDVCSFSRLDFSAAALRNLPGVVVHEAHGAAHRISVHVHVEDVHEDRDARRARRHERRLVDLGDHHDLAVGRRDDEPLAALAGALGIAEEVRDPERDDASAANASSQSGHERRVEREAERAERR